MVFPLKFIRIEKECEMKIVELLPLIVNSLRLK